MAVENYQQLRVWQSAMRLARECYLLTGQVPRSELYGVSSQVRRAAVSVPANIAEGNGRFTRADYIRHLSIANGSLREVETLLILARDLGWLEQAAVGRALAISGETGRLLTGLVRSLRTHV